MHSQLAMRNSPFCISPHTAHRHIILSHAALTITPRQVARTGLLRPRDPSTVNRWLAAYQTHGLGGLSVRPSRRAPAARGPLLAPP